MGSVTVAAFRAGDGVRCGAGVAGLGALAGPPHAARQQTNNPRAPGRHFPMGYASTPPGERPVRPEPHGARHQSVLALSALFTAACNEVM